MAADFPYELTAHAAYVIRERGIALDWVKRVLEQPEWIEPDQDDAEVRHALARVQEFGGRVLRVIYRRQEPLQIVSAYFDRRRI
jgi:hypothetical protein